MVEADGVKEIVGANISRYATIDIAKTMNDIKIVGSLLSLAYAASKGSQCSGMILSMKSDFQTLLKDSSIAATAFMNTSLKALSLHVLILSLANQGKLKEATKALATCSKLAATLVTESDKLAKESKKICDESRAALNAASADEKTSNEERKAIQQSIANHEAEEAKLAQKTTDLTSHIAELQKKEEAISKEIQRTALIGNVTAVLSVFVQPIIAAMSPGAAVVTAVGMALKSQVGSKDGQSESNPLSGILQKLVQDKANLASSLEELKVNLATKEEQRKSKTNSQDIATLDSEIAGIKASILHKEEQLKKQEIELGKLQDRFDEQTKTARQREALIEKEKAELQREFREANANLKAKVTELQHLHQNENNLATTILSLEISIKMLGRIKTVFENTRIFWIGVQKQCEDLEDTSDMEMMALSDLTSMFVNRVEDSGFSWLALAKISLTASASMKIADKEFDKVMNNIPTREEALRKVKEDSEKVIMQIEEENAQFETV